MIEGRVLLPIMPGLHQRRAMSLIFLRHGETLLNVARVLQPADTPLGPRGHAQAAVVAQRLAALRPAAIWSSDLPRALQTAHAVAAACGLAVDSSPLLQERNFGAWRGLPHDGFAFDPLAASEAPPGGESAADFHARVQAAFAAAVARRAGLPGPLVVVTHGLVLRSLLEHVLPQPAGALAQQRPGNTGVTVVAAAPPHEVSVLNCTRHLAALGALDDARHTGA